MSSNFGNDFRTKFLPILLSLQRDAYETAQARDTQIFARIENLSSKMAKEATSLTGRVNELEMKEGSDVDHLASEMREHDRLEIIIATFALATSVIIGAVITIQRCLQRGLCDNRKQRNDRRNREDEARL